MPTISQNLSEFQKYYKNKKVMFYHSDELVYHFENSRDAYREMTEVNLIIEKLNLPLTALKATNSCYFTVKSNEYEN